MATKLADIDPVKSFTFFTSGKLVAQGFDGFGKVYDASTNRQLWFDGKLASIFKINLRN
jgi:hypothetical protein